ncbi:hypothetical protein BJV78DRAFT_1251157 [Lactifluus subvellereus]|nr:hypothetical protein BJV78DRAFT_1251157 [Lactifluus subvellereus]
MILLHVTIPQAFFFSSRSFSSKNTRDAFIDPSSAPVPHSHTTFYIPWAERPVMFGVLSTIAYHNLPTSFRAYLSTSRPSKTVFFFFRFFTIRDGRTLSRDLELGIQGLPHRRYSSIVSWGILPKNEDYPQHPKAGSLSEIIVGKFTVA